MMAVPGILPAREVPAVATATPSMPVASVSARQIPDAATFTGPCWALNDTICIAANTSGGNPNVVPNSPYTNASYRQYPSQGQSIYFDIYSEKDLQAMWGGTSSVAKYTGLTSYIYLSVTDVEWNGIPWFWVGDSTVWHANAGSQWAPTAYSKIGETVKQMLWTSNPNNPPPTALGCVNVTAGDPAVCSMYAHYLYTLTITASVGDSPNFPAGSYVQWNATSVRIGGTNGQYVYSNSTSKMFGGMFSYYVKGAWYWSDAGTTGGCTPGQLYQSCYPNAPSAASCPLNGNTYSATAFGCNLRILINPQGSVGIGDNVIVTLQTNMSWQMYTGAEIKGATLNLLAYYPNGTFWRTWAVGFTPTPYGYPTQNATATIPKQFFQSAYGSVVWNITAYDQNDYTLTSQNYNEVTSQNGVFFGNFSMNLNLTTAPPIIGMEGFNGTLPWSGLLPSVALQEAVNVSISRIGPNTSIQAAELSLQVIFSGGYSEPAVNSMKCPTQAGCYFLIPALPAGANVTFFVKAWDMNDTTVVSHDYRYFIETIVLSPNPQLGFFYVKVFDNGSGRYVTGAFVNITGEGGAITIKTMTEAGIAYPNVTGKQFTPEFLPDNTSYTVIVTWLGFQAADRPAGTHSLRITFMLYHYMNATEVLLSGTNYVVEEQGDVFMFSLNVPTPPPTFANTSPTFGEYLTGAVGLVVATAIVVPVYFMWREMRKRAEEEEKRITL